MFNGLEIKWDQGKEEAKGIFKKFSWRSFAKTGSLWFDLVCKLLVKALSDFFPKLNVRHT